MCKKKFFKKRNFLVLEMQRTKMQKKSLISAYKERKDVKYFSPPRDEMKKHFILMIGNKRRNIDCK